MLNRIPLCLLALTVPALVTEFANIDANLRYQTIRETLEIVKNAGIVRVGFVTTPDR